MDINAGAIADGERTVVDRWGARFSNWFCAWLRASVRCAELLGHKEFVPWRIGPVM